MFASRNLSDAELIGRLPDLGDLTDFLGADGAGNLKRLVRPAALVGAPSDDAATDAAFEKVAEGTQRALRKVRRDGEDAQLNALERDGLEAIVELIGRPALLIQDGAFFPPQEPWKKLEDSRGQIEASIRSVGRIEVDGHPTKTWLGTAFVVAPGVVMTNRHVAREFADNAGDGWTFETGMKVRVDFHEEFGENVPQEFAVKEVIGVSDTYDMALLRTAKTSKGGPMPDPLPITFGRGKVHADRDVYVIGFPAIDSRSGDPAEQKRIFQGIYDVKRLQPGIVRRVTHHRTFEHDCSTLGGNSGSCVIDLETHAVIGLHFKGHYRVANTAVNLTLLGDDALLQSAGVEVR